MKQTFQLTLFVDILMIVIDDRLGGPPVYSITSDQRPLMRVHDAIRQCVAFVLYKRAMADPPKKIGTVFFGYPEDQSGHILPYAITCRHVIEHALANSADGKIYLRVNLKNGTCTSIETMAADSIVLGTFFVVVI
jgi:hypothetical protein